MIGAMLRTTPPPAPVLLYDGECAFCRASRDRLASLLRDDLTYLSFRDDGVLARFPGVTEEACELGLQYIDVQGRVFPGAEAAARVLLRRRWFVIAWLYYVPGVRQLIDAVYRRIAVHRFGIGGRSSACNDEVCALPGTPPPG